jgi:nitrate reductase delta subunit
MMRPSADALRLLSILLCYPDDELLGRREEIAAAIEDLPAGDMRDGLAAFMDYLRSEEPIRLQERYTALFDLNPATTLNLTWHAFGDNQERAAALARLQAIYTQAGWERTSGELPDHLPLLLEFLALAQPEAREAVWPSLRGLPALTARLENTAPAYATLLAPLTKATAHGGAAKPEEA